MNSNSINKLKKKFNLKKWSDIKQKQYNKILTDSKLKKHEVRLVLEKIDINKLEDLTNNYFIELIKVMKDIDKGWEQRIQNENEMLRDLFKSTESENMKNKIFDQIIRNSEWVKKETEKDKRLKRILVGTGVLVSIGYVTYKLRKYLPFTEDGEDIDLIAISEDDYFVADE